MKRYQQFTKAETLMTSKQRKRHPTSILIMEMLIKIITHPLETPLSTRHHSKCFTKETIYTYQIGKLLKAQQISFGKKVKQWKFAGTAGKSITTLQGHLAIWSKVEDANIISRWTPRETCMDAKNVHSSPVCNSEKMETIQMSSIRMDK